MTRHLREQIIRGALPAGERVNETKVTRELGVSRMANLKKGALRANAGSA